MRSDLAATILFYHQHHGGLGSQLRILTLARAAKRLLPQANVIVLSGNDYVPVEPKGVAGIEVLTLPRMRLAPADGRLFGRRMARNLVSEKATVLGCRKRIIDAVLREFPPSVVVVEEFPFGRRSFDDEIRHLLRGARAARTDCRIVASVKDVFGNPAIGHKKAPELEVEVAADLRECVDLIAHHTDPDIVNAAHVLEHLGYDTAGTPVISTGYVASEVRLHGSDEDASAEIVINLSSGYDTDRLLRVVEGPLEQLSHSGCSVLLISGDEGWERARRALGRLPHVRIVRSVPALGPSLAQARLAVLRGGSALVDAAARRVPAVYLPICAPLGHDEQVIRAFCFERAGFGTVILGSPEEQEAVLRNAIAMAGEAPSCRTKRRIDVQGAQRTAKLISRLASGALPDSLPPSMCHKPHVAMIEICRACNLRCPACPAGNHVGDDYGTMSRSTFDAILTEYGPYLGTVKLYNYGEPLLHPQVSEFVAAAKTAGIECVEITTNGTVLTERMGTALILAGLDLLRVSIDGTTQEEYSRYRVGGKFATVIANVRCFIATRAKLCRTCPTVELQMILMQHNEHSAKRFHDMALELGADRVTFKTFNAHMSGASLVQLTTPFIPRDRRLSRYEDSDSAELRTRRTQGTCPWPWERLVVNANGTIVPCCYDYNNAFSMGQVGVDAWSTRQRGLFQAAHLDDDAPYEMCQHCAYGNTRANPLA